MRLCGVCGQTKEDSEFYRDGKYYRFDCKECNKAKSKIWRDANPERALAMNRRPHRKAMIQATNKKWRKENLKAQRAEGKVKYAIKTGKLKRLPCFVCGEQQSEGHHPDYDQALSVVWLCAEHHKQAHSLVPRDY